MSRFQFSLATLLVVLTGMALLAGSLPVLRLANETVLKVGIVLVVAATMIAILAYLKKRSKRTGTNPARTIEDVVSESDQP